jgi:hypothetical protein
MSCWAGVPGSVIHVPRTTDKILDLQYGLIATTLTCPLFHCRHEILVAFEGGEKTHVPKATLPSQVEQKALRTKERVSLTSLAGSLRDTLFLSLCSQGQSALVGRKLLFSPQDLWLADNYNRTFP